MEAFPVDEEREDFDVICQRVSSGHSGVEPESFILLDTLDGPFSWMSKMVLFFSSVAIKCRG
ncbi:MAG: hypothetical protein MJZ09_01585 [Bacteroidales bacterium]|nr:hypothetical protein [Bacteroidales bacterium]